MITAQSQPESFVKLKQYINRFPLLLLFYLLPKKAVEEIELEWVPRNPVVFASFDFFLHFYLNEDLFPRYVAHKWGDLLWETLDIRGNMACYSEYDPMYVLVHHPYTWIDILDELGHDMERILTQAFLQIDIPYPTEEEAADFLEKVGEYLWNHPKYKVKETYELISKHRTHEDFSPLRSNPHIDFYRKYNHTQSSYETVFLETVKDQVEAIREVNFDIEDVETPHWMEDFFFLLGKRDVDIVKLLYAGLTQDQIAEKLGFANHSGVNKRIARIRETMRNFLAKQEKKVYAVPKSKPSTIRYDIIPFEYKRT